MGDKMNDKHERAMAMLEKHDVMAEIVNISNSEFKLVVEGNWGYFDYYPTTGVWTERNHVVTSSTPLINGFGLRKLIKKEVIK